MPADEPDLTAELDEAEALVLHDVTTVTEWGVRCPAGDVHFFRGGEEHARGSLKAFRGRGPAAVVVRRTVTYGPWETVTG